MMLGSRSVRVDKVAMFSVGQYLNLIHYQVAIAYVSKFEQQRAVLPAIARLSCIQQ